MIALLVLVVLIVLSVLIALILSLLLFLFLVLPVLLLVLLSSPLPRGRLPLSPAALAAVLVGRGCRRQRASRCTGGSVELGVGQQRPSAAAGQSPRREGSGSYRSIDG